VAIVGMVVKPNVQIERRADFDASFSNAMLARIVCQLSSNRHSNCKEGVVMIFNDSPIKSGAHHQVLKIMALTNDLGDISRATNEGLACCSCRN
jgi:hypothetical protein